ncbi:MAG: Glycosyltransferase, group 1 family protein [Parcubacteria group bacterium GW2011_GWE2_38_18]|nr:MAG: Glycosyltransferase, group 1 family protein [Parcubacteria group bacterium GW2011_GWE2_38_18]
MKIYFIGQKGIPARSGGVEKHVEDLATHLADAKHDVYVYTRPNYTPTELKEYKGIKLISLPTIRTKHLDAISHTFRACFLVN